MNIRQALLKAADSIEQHPKLFSFHSCELPNECGTPGCALGWLAVHLGKEEFNGRMIQKVTIMVDGRTYTIKEKETIEALAMITKKAGSKLSNQFWAV